MTSGDLAVVMLLILSILCFVALQYIRDVVQSKRKDPCKDCDKHDKCHKCGGCCGGASTDYIAMTSLM